MSNGFQPMKVFCSRCEKKYLRTGRRQKICDECLKKAIEKHRKNMSKPYYKKAFKKGMNDTRTLLILSKIAKQKHPENYPRELTIYEYLNMMKKQKEGIAV